MNTYVRIPDVGIFRDIRRDGYACQRLHGMPTFPQSRIIPEEWVPESWRSGPNARVVYPAPARSTLHL